MKLLQKAAAFMMLLSLLGFVRYHSDAQPRIIRVRPGDSLSEAVGRAPAGSTIVVSAGEYRESVVVRQPRIRIIGGGAFEQGTILSNEGVNVNNGITVMPGADEFVLAGFLINGFNQNGLLLNTVRDFRVSYNRFENNGEYGVFPIFCTGGLVTDNIAVGHTDSGLYVGKSSGVTIADNFVEQNFTRSQSDHRKHRLE